MSHSSDTNRLNTEIFSQCSLLTLKIHFTSLFSQKPIPHMQLKFGHAVSSFFGTLVLALSFSAAPANAADVTQSDLDFLYSVCGALDDGVITTDDLGLDEDQSLGFAILCTFLEGDDFTSFSETEYVWLETFVEETTYFEQTLESASIEITIETFESYESFETSFESFEETYEETSVETYEETSEETYEETSEETYEETSEETYEETSEETYEETYEETSEETYEETSEETYEETSEETYDESSDEMMEEEETFDESSEEIDEEETFDESSEEMMDEEETFDESSEEVDEEETFDESSEEMDDMSDEGMEEM